jgi:hypothetical protein
MRDFVTNLIPSGALEDETRSGGRIWPPYYTFSLWNDVKERIKFLLERWSLHISKTSRVDFIPAVKRSSESRSHPDPVVLGFCQKSVLFLPPPPKSSYACGWVISIRLVERKHFERVASGGGRAGEQGHAPITVWRLDGTLPLTSHE